MFKQLRAAYYAGMRAGFARPRIQIKGGTRGVKIIVTPECRLTGVLRRYWWSCGWHDGMMTKLNGRK